MTTGFTRDIISDNMPYERQESRRKPHFFSQNADEQVPPIPRTSGVGAELRSTFEFRARLLLISKSP